jgi:integrase
LVNLQWADIHLEPVGSAKFGYLQVRGGKSANAKRTVPLTARARKTLIERRDREPASVWVFPGLDGNPRRVNTLDQQHRKITRPKVNGVKVALFSDEFVIHSLRHTMLTRLGESGADAFTIMQIAGHSSVTVSQKYVHPTPETVERAFDRLEKLNSLAGKPKFDLKAFLYSTDFRTPPESA